MDACSFSARRREETIMNLILLILDSADSCRRSAVDITMADPALGAALAGSLVIILILWLFFGNR